MKTPRATSPLRRLSFILILVGVLAGLFYCFAPSDDKAGEENHSQLTRRSVPRFVPQLCLLSAPQLAALPLVDGFEYPCGSPKGAMVYDAQPLNSLNAARGGYHTGADLNGIGGGASDEALPVYAAARGLVVYSGRPSDSWGNVVVLAHRLPDGRVVQSLYAHLKDRQASLGSYLARGQYLGSIGSAEGRYVPHLHVEFVESLRIAAAQPGYLPQPAAHYYDITQLMREYPAPAIPDCYQSIRRRLARSSLQFSSVQP